VVGIGGWSSEGTLRKRQFQILFRMFLFRVVDVELLALEADPQKLLAQIVTVLLSFSFLVSIPVLFMGGPLAVVTARTFEHFFIATTMLVVGLFAVLSWESVFPDRRDVMVLAPLPIEQHTMFLAKIAAVGSGLGAAVCALNGISGLLWPWIFAPAHSGFAGPLRSFAAFWATLAAAAIFVFGSTLTIEAVAGRVLPRQMYLRLSAMLQMLVLCVLLTVYALEPSLESNAALGLAANHRLLEWLPSYWFLGMFQQMSGAGANVAVFQWLAHRAWVAVLFAGAGGAGTVMLSYFYAMRRIAEQAEIVPWRKRKERPRGSSVENVVLWFAVCTISRSRQHRMIMSFYMGAGFGVMLVLLRPAMASHEGVPMVLLAASALMLCTASVAMRTVFSMPITLEANWVFRVAALNKAEGYLRAVRRSILLLAVAPVWCGFSVLLLFLLPWRAAAAHLALLALLGMMLADVLSGGFKKIPFTCSYRPGRANVQFALWGVLVLLPLFLLAAGYEWRSLHAAGGQLATATALVVPAALLRWWTTRRMRLVEELQFEDIEEPQIVSLEIVVDRTLRADGQATMIC
jgi:hypothetical protein